VAGGIALLRCRAAQDRRFSPLGLLVVVSLCVSYGGGTLALRWPVDPCGFVAPAAFAAALPAAWLLVEIPFWRLATTGPALLRVVLPLALLLAAQRTYRTIATYVTELLPSRVLRSPLDLQVSALVGLNEPLPEPLRHEPPPARSFAVAAWLSEHAGGRGRVLADDPELGALLVLTTSLPVVAPLGERGGASRGADPTALLEGSPAPAAVEEWLTRYAIGWVVLTGPAGPLDRDAPFLEPALDVSTARVRRVVREPSWFAEGEARLAAAKLGLLRVEEARGARLTLRYHHDGRFACRPGCRVERVEVPGDGAGFLSVPEPPPVFELFVR